MAKAFPIRHVVYIGNPAEQRLRYRRIIPANLRPRLDGRKEWSHTYRRGTKLSEIERDAKVRAAQHDALLARAKAGETIAPAVIAQAERDAAVFLAGDKAALYEWQGFLANEATRLPVAHPYRVQLNALEHGGKFVPDVLTLTAANERRSGTRNQRDVANAIKTWVRVMGEKDIRAIRRSDVKQFIAHELARGLKPSAIRRRLVSLSGIVTDTFDDMEVAQPNPFARLKIEGAAPSVDDKECFDRKALATIDSYVAASKRISAETRNVFSLLKFTGAGPNEIGGLVLGDVRLDAAVPHIIIRENEVRGLKVRSRDPKQKSPRERKVPLLGEALEAAKDAVKRAKVRDNRPDARLFTRGFGKNGRKADAISANLNQIIDRAGIKSKKLTLYSYRHTLKEAMVAAGIEEHLRKQIMGHTAGDPPAGRDSHDRYGAKRRPLSELRDALAKALTRLGDVETEEEAS